MVLILKRKITTAEEASRDTQALDQFEGDSRLVRRMNVVAEARPGGRFKLLKNRFGPNNVVVGGKKLLALVWKDMELEGA